MAHINLEAVDADGAIREAADAVAGDTRMSFLRKGAMGGAAALSGGAILSALVPGAAMAKGRPAVQLRQGRHRHPQLRPDARVPRGGVLRRGHQERHVTNKALKQFLATTKKDENTHVATLKKALGSKAAKKPKFDFRQGHDDPDKFAATAYVLENTGVHAYIGQAFNIKTAGVPAGVAASIVTVEARHAGAIGLFLGKSIAPSGPFDTGLTAAKVLKAVKGTGFIKG